MARREEHLSKQQQQIHYATILPSNGHKKNHVKPETNGHEGNESPITKKQTELERAKALYVDFEDAFQDETTNHDFFGFQPNSQLSSNNQPEENTDKPVNFYLQSVETISEIKNSNFSPLMRYQASRENSRPSTPSDTPPYIPRMNSHINGTPPLPHVSRNRRNSINSTDVDNMSVDFSNLNILHSNDLDDSPAPFTPDAIRIKFTQNQYDNSPLPSSQFKFILPQYFLVKYLGRTACTQLWGAEAVRKPIDDMVHTARQLSSMNEIPTLEACINTRGLTLTHRHSPVRSKHHSRAHSPDRRQHGLIPLEYISYVMHDVKYSKVSTCIVLRQSKSSSSQNKKSNEPVTECYGFLFQSKEHAHRFALSLAEAFNAQKRSAKGHKQHHDDKREPRSPQRRSKYRHGHAHERTRGKYDDSYLRDSEV